VDLKKVKSISIQGEASGTEPNGINLEITVVKNDGQPVTYTIFKAIA
jgi:hypothetical protein